MIVQWIPCWYDLDPTLIVGDQGYFYLTKDMRNLATALSSDDEHEVIASVVSITHSELVNVKAIDCNGLDYFIYYDNGKILTVCSEENPGMIHKGEFKFLNDWTFKIEIELLEDTGLKAIERRSKMTRLEFKQYCLERREKQDQLIRQIENDAR
jgi:hypothetical protein